MEWGGEVGGVVKTKVELKLERWDKAVEYLRR
jgi:hypothetical protein